MPDKRRRPERETPHKDKICKACGRVFSWRKEWAQDWGVMKYCSDACRGRKPGEADTALETAILELLAESDAGKTICPSDAAKHVGGFETRRDWEGLIEAAYATARRLAKAGKIDIVQNGRVVDGATVRGSIRLRLR